LIVKSVIKIAAHNRGYRCGDDFLEELNNRVTHLLDDAIVRAEANDRRTLKSHDVG
jgi:hypothetical protein